MGNESLAIRLPYLPSNGRKFELPKRVSVKRFIERLDMNRDIMSDKYARRFGAYDYWKPVDRNDLSRALQIHRRSVGGDYGSIKRTGISGSNYPREFRATAHPASPPYSV